MGCTLTRRIGRPIAATTVDLGCTGMSVATTRPLAIDEQLHFDLPALPFALVSGRARVLRDQGHDVYGLRFEALERRAPGDRRAGRDAAALVLLVVLAPLSCCRTQRRRAGRGRRASPPRCAPPASRVEIRWVKRSRQPSPSGSSSMRSSSSPHRNAKRCGGSSSVTDPSIGSISPPGNVKRHRAALAQVDLDRAREPVRELAAAR